MVLIHQTFFDDQQRKQERAACATGWIGGFGALARSECVNCAGSVSRGAKQFPAMLLSERKLTLVWVLVDKQIQQLKGRLRLASFTQRVALNTQILGLVVLRT